MTMMKKAQQGFTLIELMIVVAIIGILASIAIPAYQDYMTRSKWAKAVATMSAVKLSVSECLNDAGGTLSACKFADLSKYGITAMPVLTDGSTTMGTMTIDTNGGAIQLTGGAALGSCSFTFTPSVQAGAGAVIWDTTGPATCTKFLKGSH
jgi:type IV pilus assembly protein PilA